MVMKTYKSASGATIEIDEDKCTGCGECVNICPAEVFELVDEKATAPKADDCTECCACVEACPEKVIKHSSCE
ncbi:MAG: 4Fe-4S binding protein [Thermoplasmata archaeon]|nr:4Fe-4S binding protein [Thermoplasmata archaeon]